MDGELSISNLPQLLHMDSALCHLGKHHILVHIPSDLWIFPPIYINNCIQSFPRSLLFESALLASYSARCRYSSSTVLFLLKFGENIIPQVPQHDTEITSEERDFESLDACVMRFNLFDITHY